MATDIVIAAKNAEELLPACLGSIISQLDRTAGDRAVVVDDGSTDATASIAESRGADVIRLNESVGPYLARDVAAAESRADLLIFVDVRSRVLPGWLSSHKQQLSRADAALSCTNVQVLSGPSYAERVSAVVNMFDLSNYLNRPGQLDYFPTCNLGVRSAVYTSVGGFKTVRSGGDADFCWRVQRSGAGRLTADPRVLMLWKPRSRVASLVEQSFRYGRAHAALISANGAAADQLHAPDNHAANHGKLARLRSRLQGNPGDVRAVVGSYALLVPSTLGRAVAASTKTR